MPHATELIREKPRGSRAALFDGLGFMAVIVCTFQDFCTKARQPARF